MTLIFDENTKIYDKRKQNKKTENWKNKNEFFKWIDCFDGDFSNSDMTIKIWEIRSLGIFLSLLNSKVTLVKLENIKNGKEFKHWFGINTKLIEAKKVQKDQVLREGSDDWSNQKA